MTDISQEIGLVETILTDRTALHHVLIASLSEQIVNTLAAHRAEYDAVFRVSRKHPDTSKAIEPKIRSGTFQDRLLRWFMEWPEGATDYDLEERLHRSHQSVSATRNTLYRKGYLRDSGQRRKNRHGNEAIVWVWTGLKP